MVTRCTVSHGTTLYSGVVSRYPAVSATRPGSSQAGQVGCGPLRTYERTKRTNERTYYGGVWVSLDNGIAKYHHPPPTTLRLGGGRPTIASRCWAAQPAHTPLRLLLEQSWMPLFAEFVVCAICQAGKPSLERNQESVCNPTGPARPSWKYSQSGSYSYF